MTAGAVARDRGDPARAHRRHRRAQARGRARRHRARRRPGERAGHAVDGHRPSPRSPRSPTSSPHSLPPGMPAGLEASARYTAHGADRSGRTPPTCARARSTSRTGRGHAAALHRERGLRPDDQPERRRGPDRRRRRCRASAARCSSTSPTTSDGNPLATTFMDYLLPTAAEVPIIEYGHIETPEPGPGRLQGRGRGRRDRRAAGGRQRGGRRARAVRRDRHAAAADARRGSWRSSTGEGGTPNRTRHRMDVTATEVYYDPYDVEIDADPYPVFRRLREEAPLYYNEQYDFYALSRFDDVERGLVDRETYISGRGGILELIKAEHRDAARRPHLRGPADAHHPPRAAVAGVHAAADERARAEDPRVLRAAASTRSSARTGSTSSPTSARRCRCG